MIPERIVLFVLAVAVAGGAACSRSPAAPSSGVGQLDLTTAGAPQAAVRIAVYASMTPAMAPPPLSDGATTTVGCPAGGTISVTRLSSSSTAGSFASSYRTRYDECHFRSGLLPNRMTLDQDVTLRGELVVTNEGTYTPHVGDVPPDGNSTSHATGIVQFTIGVVEGRGQYDCTLKTQSSATAVAFSWLGTIVWEVPVSGSTTVGTCTLAIP